MPRFEWSKLKEQLKAGDTIYWYDEKGKLLLSDNSKTKAQKKIKKIKYEGVLYRLVMSFHTGKLLGQGGPLAIHCQVFKKENDKLTKIRPKSTGFVWFPLSYLERSGWKPRFLNYIVEKLIGGLEFGFGVYNFRI